MKNLCRMTPKANRNAFTLVELLATISILAILGAILMAALSGTGTSRDKAVSTGNIRQVVLGLHLYSQANKGLLPLQFDAGRNLDWSGALVEDGYLTEDVFHAPADEFTRRLDGTPRSYAVNSATYTFLQNGYRSPWPKNRTEQATSAMLVPPTVMLVGENFGGAIDNSGAVVGVAEFEGLNAETYNFYDDTGAHYCMADGSVVFMSKEEIDQYRADTDYNGDPKDPWKWKP
ncbi:MAG: type II secretion system protein [Puniceicoccales bacterium]